MFVSANHHTEVASHVYFQMALGLISCSMEH